MAVSFIMGLLIAFGGAGLLAVGSEMQSRAVVLADGRIGEYLRSPTWLGGAGLLGIGIGSNVWALSLAPVSAVQSIGIVALVCSVAYGGLTGRIRITWPVVASAAVAIAGVVGIVALLCTHAGTPRLTDLDDVRSVILLMVFSGAAVGAALVGTHLRGTDAPRWLDSAVLVLGAIVFGCTTTVLKVIVSLVQDHGVIPTMTNPLVMVAILLWVVVGIAANIAVQRSFTRFPTATVVAGTTIVDPVAAAVIGVWVLGEATLGPAATVCFVTLLGMSAVGVIGLTRIQRCRPQQTPPHPVALGPVREPVSERA